MKNELAKHHNIPQLVEEYDIQCSKIREGYRLIREASENLKRVFLDPHIQIAERHGKEPHWHRPEDALKEVEQRLWRTLVDHLEVRRFMSIRRWEETERMLNEGTMPPITEKSIQDMLASFEVQIETMQKEAVEEVYRILRPPVAYTRLKTHADSVSGVKQKAILCNYLEPGLSWGNSPSRFRVDWRSKPRLVALENVFRSLDGKGQTTRNFKADIEESIESSAEGSGETEYFKWAGFDNGNLHIRFKRMDLVQELNRIAGGGTLNRRAS